MYTSGTTGTPKGVEVENGPLMNLCYWHNNYYNVTEKDNTTKFAGVGFDASVWEIFPYIIKGATIYIIDEEIRLNVEKLNEYYEKVGITISFLPTSIFEQFIKLPNNTLRALLTGADKLKYYEEKVYNIYNNYGPTEYTVVSTAFKVERDYKNIPIGKPIGNTNIYILDKNKKLLPIGVAGELYVAGDGLARGYVNNKELTSEKFIDNPFKIGEKMYKTGDLARWLEDGNIEYLGRIDYQVKIRGFRVELEEIERTLLNINGIKSAVVIDKVKDEYKYLCAYYVSNRNYTITELRENLLKTLPEYMVPAYFMSMDKLPLTANGKIDKKVLSNLKCEVNTGREYIEPRNRVEKILADIWSSVLGVEKIGIDDSFFELGGHSLKATVLIGKIHKELNVEIPIHEFFEKETIRNISNYIEKAEKEEFKEIDKVEKKEYYEASSAEKRMYVIQQFSENSIAYNVPAAIQIEGKLDVYKLQKTIIEIIYRHEILRTNFFALNGNVYQKVREIDELDFKVENIEVDGEKDIYDYYHNEFIRPFNLEKDWLIRIGIAKVEETKYIFLFDTHHIVSDGAAISIFMKELSEIYSQKKLEPLRIQYKDYSKWQSDRNKSEKVFKQKQYWLSEFEGEIPILNLQTDFNRPLVQDYKGDVLKFRINKKETAELRKIAQNTNSTMFMVLLASIKILLSKNSGQEDIIVGSPIAGRNHKDLENLIGMFVNTLAIRSTVDNNMTFEEYLDTVRNKTLRAYENQDYQFEDLVENLEIERNLSRNALFDIMFVLQNTDELEMKIDNLMFKQIITGNHIEKFDMTFEAVEKNDEILFNISYSVSLFKDETIEKIKDQLLMIVHEIAKNSKVKIKDISIISEEEKRKIIEVFNDTTMEYPINKTLIQLFEERVCEMPKKVALISESGNLTYREVNEKANFIARILIDKGVSRNNLVGIMINRSLEMVIGILAVLKAGGAYVPIDPSYPDKRINYIIDNSELQIILVERQFSEKIEFPCELLIIDDVSEINMDKHNIEINRSPEDLVYVIYTSGTTGNPKGVVIKNNAVVNILFYLEKKYPLKDMDSYLFKTNYCFDVSVTEIFGWFIGKGSLVILPIGYEKDPSNIIDEIYKNRITHMNITSSMLNVFLGEISEKNKYKIKSLKYIIQAGEALKLDNIDKAFEKLGDTNLENIYGPTEATIYTICYHVDKNDKFFRIPIGKPVANTEVYILDKFMNMVPIGVVGEMYLSGVCLAKGYLNNEEQTCKSFIENPFEIGKYMYKTGDLAKWLPDGNIDYIGRVDHQVKIRGFRVEIDEVERSILKIQGIKEVVVLAKENESTNYLCAYYVGDTEYRHSYIRDEITKSIPSYMVPTYFIKIDSIPVTSNGKVNRRELMKLEGGSTSSIEYKGPENDIERAMVAVWQNVLGIRQIGVQDDFFDLGGDSIKAMQIVSKLKMYNYYIEVKDVFKSLTIRNLSKCVKYKGIEIDEKEVTGNVQLAPIQKWFFDANFEKIDHWNQAIMLYRESRFDEKILEKVFKKIIDHHDALRICFKEENSEIIAINRDSKIKGYEFNVYDLMNLNINVENEIKNLCNKVQESMSIERGPLVKVALFKTNRGDHLLIAIHHLVVDGVSWRIILEDINNLYSSLEKGQEVSLPPKTTSYKMWADEIKNNVNSRVVTSSIEYWKSVENTHVDELPKDKKVTGVYIGKMAKVKTDFLLEEESQDLLNNVNKAYNTEINDILISALVRSISMLSNSDKVLISLEGHGREEIFNKVDITRTVGWFTAKYPVIFSAGADNSYSKLIKNTKDTLKRIPNKGVTYGILKYIRENEDSLEFKLKPEISFNYLGRFREDMNTDTFEKSNIDCGELISLDNLNLYNLDFTVINVKNRFEISLIYNSDVFNEETIDKIIKDYKNSLVEIIHHCKNKDDSEITITDITNEDITYEELSKYGNDLNNIQGIYKLTMMQQGMFYHSRLDEKSESYHESVIVGLEGEVDVNTLDKAYKKLVERYEVLRTNFDGSTFKETMQIVCKHKDVAINYRDISKMTESKEDMINSIVISDRLRGFNLENDVLIRLILIKVNDQDYKLILSNHHIIMDGWSLGIVLEELFELYHYFKVEESVNLSDVPSNAEYFKWLESRDRGAAKEFWYNYLLNVKNISKIPNDLSISNCKYKNNSYEIKIIGNKLRELEKIVSRNKVTMNTLIETVWGIQLQKYNEDDLAVFGVVVSGRDSKVENIENMVGLFINTIPLKVLGNKDMKFENLVARINNDLLECQEYSYCSLAEIQQLTKIKGELINHVMVFENYPIDMEKINGEMKSTGLDIKDFKGIEQTNYDFNIIVSYAEEITIKFMYNENTFSKENIEMIGKHFINIVNVVIEDSKVKIGDIDMIQNELKVKEIEEKIEEELENSTHSIEFNF
ncbi:amino acid adenylation domain-containing protein [Clostridium beijerinckii]|uniref:amino acid adenylation domain-containing protein n=1 Tax=Clostridium beijerinckii TaxID=1520 RepID=UPI0030FE5CE1